MEVGRETRLSIIYRVCDIQVGKLISWITVRGEGGGVAGDKRLLVNETLIGIWHNEYADILLPPAR